MEYDLRNEGGISLRFHIEEWNAVYGKSEEAAPDQAAPEGQGQSPRGLDTLALGTGTGDTPRRWS